MNRSELARFYRENRTLFVPETQVLGECEMLMDLHAWDPARVKPKDWLENFDDLERPYALQMLHRFVFFPDHLTDELLVAAFHQTSALVAEGKTFRGAIPDWQAFRAHALLTYVTGEEPSPTDSGFLFARKARQALGFGESGIIAPDEAVRRIAATPGLVLVFVDDFVGSGDQFCKTWDRPIECAAGEYRSFADLSALGHIAAVFYCNAVSTAKGRNRIAANCPGVEILSGNVIGSDWSFLDDVSTRWPPQLIAAGRAFVQNLKSGYDFQAENGGERDWRGYRRLGLGLAFAHSTPDATLPIFHSDRNGWRPLVRRS